MEHFSNEAILKSNISQMEHFSNGAILKWSNSQIEHFSNGAIWGRHHQLDDSLVGQLTRKYVEYLRHNPTWAYIFAFTGEYPFIFNGFEKWKKSAALVLNQQSLPLNILCGTLSVCSCEDCIAQIN